MRRPNLILLAMFSSLGWRLPWGIQYYGNLGSSMAYNLFISYDLMPPGQNYEAVQDLIKKLGRWHKFQYSLFYVNTEYSPQDAFTHVSAALDRDDRLAVIDAHAGVVTTGDKPPIDAINAIWFGIA